MRRPPRRRRVLVVRAGGRRSWPKRRAQLLAAPGGCGRLAGLHSVCRCGAFVSMLWTVCGSHGSAGCVEGRAVRTGPFGMRTRALVHLRVGGRAAWHASVSMTCTSSSGKRRARVHSLQGCRPRGARWRRPRDRGVGLRGSRAAGRGRRWRGGSLTGGRAAARRQQRQHWRRRGLRRAVATARRLEAKGGGMGPAAQSKQARRQGRRRPARGLGLEARRPRLGRSGSAEGGPVPVQELQARAQKDLRSLTTASWPSATRMHSHCAPTSRAAAPEGLSFGAVGPKRLHHPRHARARLPQPHPLPHGRRSRCHASRVRRCPCNGLTPNG
jgi:hypothetical protein